MRSIDITDFSGGINEAVAPSDFTDRQWTQLKGFFLKDETRLMSQWPLQQIGAEGGFREIRGLTAYDGTKYLVGIKTNGEVWKTTLPGNDATYAQADAATWTRLTSSNGTSTLTVGTNAHFMCEVSFQVATIANGTKIPALLINQSDNLSDTVGPVFIWAHTNSSIGAYRVLDTAGTGIGVYPGYMPAAPSGITLTDSTPPGTLTVSWTPENSGSGPLLGWRIYDNAGTLKTTAAANVTSVTFAGLASGGAVVRGYNAYGETPFTAEGGVRVPATGYLPRANVATVWSGQLILGDIEYYRNAADIAAGTALSSSNSARLRNGIWFSNPSAPTQFDPLAVFTVGNPDTVITGFQVLPQGLLVTTNSSTNDTGLYLLRGTNAGIILEEALTLNFNVELLRGGISTASASPAPGTTVTLWPAVGTIAFIDNKARLWQTNTDEVIQLDQYGPNPPSSFTSTDCLATWDRYLFMSRAGRLLVMREFGAEGSWTELSLPYGVVATSMTEIGNSLYFIAAGEDQPNQVWRFNLAPVGQAELEYGLAGPYAMPLVVITRPVGEPSRFDKQMWHRIGLRARGNGILTGIESYGASPLLGVEPLYATTYDPPKIITDRFEVIVPAHGPSIEAAARMVMYGKIELEAVTFYVHGRAPRRV